jgi:hypothetical protein
VGADLAHPWRGKGKQYKLGRQALRARSGERGKGRGRGKGKYAFKGRRSQRNIAIHISCEKRMLFATSRLLMSGKWEADIIYQKVRGGASVGKKSN